MVERWSPHERSEPAGCSLTSVRRKLSSQTAKTKGKQCSGTSNLLTANKKTACNDNLTLSNDATQKNKEQARKLRRENLLS
jgi:hypothetical protein